MLWWNWSGYTFCPDGWRTTRCNHSESLVWRLCFYCQNTSGCGKSSPRRKTHSSADKRQLLGLQRLVCSLALSSQPRSNHSSLSFSLSISMFPSGDVLTSSSLAPVNRTICSAKSISFVWLIVNNLMPTILLNASGIHG